MHVWTDKQFMFLIFVAHANNNNNNENFSIYGGLTLSFSNSCANLWLVLLWSHALCN